MADRLKRDGMKTVAILAPHFPPSNLAGVHRARLLSQHLQEFGWRPIVVTTHWRYYDETLDWDLANLVPQDLEVVRTRAMPVLPFRPIGDIGIRAFFWHRAAIKRLLDKRMIDFLHITIPSFYSALIGQSLYFRKPMPFGIDFIDPWVHAWDEEGELTAKRWGSARLANRLEPLAVRNASLITGVAPGYYEGVKQRNPQLSGQCAFGSAPYGSSSLDFEAALALDRRPYLFEPGDGNFHMVYAGALLPKGKTVLRQFFAALYQLKEKMHHYRGIRLHFIGTGTSPTDKASFGVLPLAKEAQVDDIVTEHPHRMSYADVLIHLAHSSAPLILGSTERHYTPSKVFQAVQSRKPVFAVLHQASTAVDVLRRSGAGSAVTLTEASLPSVSDLARALESFIASSVSFDPNKVRWDQFEAFSARESARMMALALDAGLRVFDARFSR